MDGHTKRAVSYRCPRSHDRAAIPECLRDESGNPGITNGGP